MWEKYEGKVIFITGASGFLGTALVYRLVKEAPVERIYVLCRGGLSRLVQKWSEWLPTDTVEEMTDPTLVTVIDGDILKQDLGIKPEDMKALAARVNIVIHSASSINLKAPLSTIASTVVDASERLASLALSWEHLECFVFVSTAYSNAHLHALSGGSTDVEVKETIYPLLESGDNVEQERAEIQTSGSSVQYDSHDFIWSYAYAKHLTERLLSQMFEAANKGFLIVRPSIIGPSQSFPYYQFCVPMSCPLLTTAAAFGLAPSRSVRCASGFPDPMRQATFDEVPVDVVVDRLLAHVAVGTTGVVHAVGGPPSRVPFGVWWKEVLRVRNLPWDVMPQWTKLHWSSPELHPVPRLMKVIGMSFNFLQDKTVGLSESLDESERAGLQLFHQWVGSEQYDLRAGKRQVWYCMNRFTRKRRWSRYIAKLYYGSWRHAKLYEERSAKILD